MATARKVTAIAALLGGAVFLVSSVVHTHEGGVGALDFSVHLHAAGRLAAHPCVACHASCLPWAGAAEGDVGTAAPPDEARASDRDATASIRAAAAEPFSSRGPPVPFASIV